MDKYDPIAWEHTGAVAKIIDQIRPDDYPWKKTLYDGPDVLKMFCHGFVGLDKFNKA